MFYVLLKVRVTDGYGDIGTRIGDIVSATAFDDWDTRPIGGRSRYNKLLIYIILPDAARKFMPFFTGPHTWTGVHFHDEVSSLFPVIAKRRRAIPWQMIRDRWSGFWASVEWYRLWDFGDDYQPWVNGDIDDRVFDLRGSRANFIRDKFRDNRTDVEADFHYMTDGDFNDAINSMQ